MNKPWVKSYYGARQRCLNKNGRRYGSYGGRGIEMRMTVDDFKKLWFRDKAHKMKRPSIDRIDNDGHYELSNCRFIELRENRKRNRASEKTHCMRGHLFTKENTQKATTGRRRCAKCSRLQSKAWREARWKPKDWALYWYSNNKTDGVRQHIIRDRWTCLPVLFRTRKAAREYAEEHYGYIKSREDLRQEPHGWRMPRPFLIDISKREANDETER